jgi:hypothetical protein
MITLKQAQARVLRTRKQHAEARAVRDELVREATAAGKTHREIHEETGLTRGRVGQIVHGKR